MSSTGFMLATTAVDDSQDGTVTWSDPSNVIASDDSRATTPAMNDTEETHWLRSQSGTIADLLEDTDSIQGIEVRVEHQASAANQRVSHVSLFDAASRLGTQKTPNTVQPVGSDQTDDYGTTTDLWSATLRAEMLRHHLEVGVRCDRDALGTGISRIDAISVRIQYIRKGRMRQGLRRVPGRGYR